MNGTPPPGPTAIPLKVWTVEPQTIGGKFVTVGFNRPPTDDELDRMRQLPPSPRIADDLSEMIRRTMTFEIVARLCRAYVLSGVLRSEGPEVTKWLRRYIDGDKDLGPLGAPMPWPEGLLETSAMLREWGFERSPNGWIARAGTYGTPAGTRTT